MFPQGRPLLLNDPLVNRENLIWLAAELKIPEAEGRFHQHKDGYFSLQGEPISW